MQTTLLRASFFVFTTCALISCGGGGGGSTPSTIPSSNNAPLANAGIDQAVSTGSNVSISGSQSSDADNDTLTYTWTLSTIPTSSTASLSATSTVQSSFVADISGNYVATLIVNDGQVSSIADTVNITASQASTSNNTPLANAGIDQAVSTGSNVSISGSQSSDADNDTLTYTWTLSTIPTSSTASLSATSTVQSSFVADISGNYVATLIVNDGQVSSIADTVSITASTSNNAPLANAGIDQAVSTGSNVSISGSQSSDADNETLTYTWTLTTIPTSSTASLSATSTVQSSFVADISGNYVATLIVNDGQVSSIADTVSITASQASTSNADFYAPGSIADALQLSRAVTWTELTTTPKNLTRFSMGQASTTDIFVLTDEDNSIGSNLTVSSGLAAQTSAKDDLLLRSMFKFIELDDGNFRIVSTKHHNYVLDVSDPGVDDEIVLRDIRSVNVDTGTAAYLAFNITSSSSLVLSAVARKIYNSGTKLFDNDGTWSNKEVVLSSGALSLVEPGSGTAMTLYSPPIDLDIPFDFNPDEIERVSNSEVTPIGSDANVIATTANQVVEAYADQVAASGTDAGTTAAVDAMIAAIEASLTAEGAQLRYPAEFYTTFRAGLFARRVQSSDSTDGVLGQLSVPYVYFTNASDDSGNHHPFMVIASYGLPDSMTLLWDVPKPPGDGIDPEYANQSVTRSNHLENFLLKIPMRDYGEVETLSENVMNNDLASDVGISVFDHHNYASVSATGVAIDGVVIYPSYNNSLHVSQSAAELSAHGMHSGRGLGVHYHADAHSATGAGLNLYNAEDYAGHSHPPIVSIGFDGVAGYGVYLDGDTTSDGANIALDSFGGHEHGGYAYHYHSFTAAETTEISTRPGDPPGGVEYTAHQLPPLGAWSGRINDIPEFWDGTSPNYKGGLSIYLGTE